MAPNAKQASEQAGSGDTVIGWSIRVGRQREELLQQFEPRYPNTVADHVTLKAKASRDAPLPDETQGEIIGRTDDGQGVEALVVRIGGTTERPDGSTYHITWSLGPGREAKESNDVLRDRGWEEIDLPVPVRLEPKRWP